AGMCLAPDRVDALARAAPPGHLHQRVADVVLLEVDGLRLAVLLGKAQPLRLPLPEFAQEPRRGARCAGWTPRAAADGPATLGRRCGRQGSSPDWSDRVSSGRMIRRPGADPLGYLVAGPFVAWLVPTTEAGKHQQQAHCPGGGPGCPAGG